MPLSDTDNMDDRPTGRDEEPIRADVLSDGSDRRIFLWLW